MLASGHSSVQMDNRYVHLQRADVVNAFGTASGSQKCDRGVTDRDVGTGGA